MRIPVYSTPQEAEFAFYQAFERADLEAMMGVWAEDESIVCVHPMGPSLRGRHAVEDSWRQILNGDSEMRFRIEDAQYTQDALLSIHCVHENIDHGPGLQQHALVIATNVYRRTDNGWRMVLHHASPGVVHEALTPAPSQSLH